MQVPQQFSIHSPVTTPCIRETSTWATERPLIESSLWFLRNHLRRRPIKRWFLRRAYPRNRSLRLLLGSITLDAIDHHHPRVSFTFCPRFKAPTLENKLATHFTRVGWWRWAAGRIRYHHLLWSVSSEPFNSPQLIVLDPLLFEATFSFN